MITKLRYSSARKLTVTLELLSQRLWVIVVAGIAFAPAAVAQPSIRVESVSASPSTITVGKPDSCTTVSAIFSVQGRDTDPPPMVYLVLAKYSSSPPQINLRLLDTDRQLTLSNSEVLEFRICNGDNNVIGKFRAIIAIAGKPDRYTVLATEAPEGDIVSIQVEAP